MPAPGMEKTTLAVPVIPTIYGVVVFILLVLLLVQKEIQRALERPGSRRWIVISNSMISLLLVLHGLILLSGLLRILDR
jgi:hypothetical protein